ncbi:DUF4442 domain-containing protein [Lysobacter sp. TY2-98]|uniref:hotdog fold domain-containing protein n=1 Tax=Lysobacter sp. TY2-98 TaxID=2290922 RepID=UPI000E2089F2|nr:hotdog fold domain-containing protein [Lysobacter sp. TY2-98]AXK71342.1 DUF4442 domain-containing protein [Lysobacter sp. TY2-98]
MNLLALHRRVTRWPLGTWLFSRAVCFKAPYFASIAPRVDALEPGRCVVSFRHRRAVTNHIGTVHAIALCNAAELAAGLAIEAGLPPTLRWIPKGMQVEYLRKAMGRMTATATVRGIVDSRQTGDVPVVVEVRDPSNEIVVRAVIGMWVSARPTGDA